MKKIIALLAGALCFGVVAAETAAKAEENKLTLENLSGESLHQTALLPVAEVKAQLAAIHDAVAASDAVGKKRTYAFIATAVYARENPKVTYAELLAKLVENRTTIGIPADIAPDEYERVILYNGWFTGCIDKTVYGHLYKEGLEATKDVTLPAACWEYAQSTAYIYDLEKAVPYYEKAGGAGQSKLAQRYVSVGETGKAAPYFWEALAHGVLSTEARALFPQILAYELEQENFDAAALKSKLNKAILLYKAKARQWKPTKEGEANPYIEFVGMLQDTAKDL